MNKTNIVDFSNVFSPKSQSILAKGHLILSQLSKTQNISTKKSSASKSPTNKKQFIANFPKSQSYRINSKIVLTNDRIRQIHDRLDIDTTTMQQFEKRIKTDKLYFDEKDNPFTSEFQIKEKSPKRFQAKTNIISEMARVKQITFEKSNRKLTYMPSPAKEIIVKMQKSRDKNNPKSKERKSKTIETFAKQIQERQQRIKDEFQQLDELIQTKEQNFFEKLYHRQPKNIFLLIKDKNHPDFRSNRQILNLLYFNLDSMVSLQKQKFHTNILQQISSYSRLLVKGLKSKKMPQIMALTSGDLNIDFEKLSFEETMLISSGKLTSSVLMTYIREEEEDIHKKKKLTEDENSKQNEKNAIHYRDRTKNVSIDYNTVDQMKTQIQYYGKSEYTSLQKRQNIMSKTLKNKLNKVIQQELRVISHTIRDKRVMHKFAQEKNRALDDLLQTNADNRINLLMKEVQRKIRMHKLSKNRTEKIKIDTLTEAFRMKKMIEKSKEKKSNSRESRYSPLKTWRG